MQLLKTVQVLLILFFVTESIATTQHITLESSTLLEFSQLVSDIVKKPVIISADLDKPFSINAEFKNNLHLIEMLRFSIVSAGFGFDLKKGTIVISDYGILDSPELVTRIYQLRHLPSNEAYKLFLSLFNSRSFTYINDQTDSSKVISVNNVKNLSNSNSLLPSVVDSGSNNSLVITATETQHINISKIIQGIDNPRKQVLIEAVISELSDSDFQGLETKLEYTNGLDSIVSDLQAFRPDVGLALKFLNSKSLRFYLDYLETTDHSEILSQPKIITLDREPAKVIVGQNVPFITGQSTSEASDTENPFQTIKRADIGLKLYVTPVVTPSGLIELEIYQESSSVNTETVAADIVTNIRSLTSKVLLRDGQSVVLGGLVSKIDDKGHAGSIPFISDLPLIGWLFSSNTDSTKNVHLVVVISASIIKSGHSLPDTAWLAGNDQANLNRLDVPVTHHK